MYVPILCTNTSILRTLDDTNPVFVVPVHQPIRRIVSDEVVVFTRKFWMVLQTMALVVAPGGVGTMDELFEVMTLQQCGKIKVKFPIILFGKVSITTRLNPCLSYTQSTY